MRVSGDWKNDTFNQSGSFTQHSSSVKTSYV